MSDPRTFYTGWLVDEADRDTLLARFPPAYPIVVAHHVTLKFGDAEAHAPEPADGRIIGVADDGEGVEAMVVEVDGSADRPDGGTFHITWSLAEGRHARESNAVIAARGWRAVEPAAVKLIPKAP